MPDPKDLERTAFDQLAWIVDNKGFVNLALAAANLAGRNAGDPAAGGFVGLGRAFGLVVVAGATLPFYCCVFFLDHGLVNFATRFVLEIQAVAPFIAELTAFFARVNRNYRVLGYAL